MTEIKLYQTDYVYFLHQFAVSIKAPIKSNTVQIPLGVGNGWLWAENLPSGMSILVYDMKLNKNVSLLKPKIQEEIFSLHFDEYFIESKNINGSKSESLTKSLVKLTTSTNLEIHHFPPNVRIKGIKFNFKKNHFLELIDNYLVEKIFNQILLSELNPSGNEIINMNYRLILDELINPYINQPLKLNFIQNRILLLFETFVKKNKKAKVVPLKAKINDSELERLMIAESLLVKDYATPPPTIQNLSRICAMSATKLKNDFKSLYGLPIYEYYQKSRMSKAKALLLEGLYTCKEVGSQIGYSNLSHFASAFKKEFGISPSDLLSKRGRLMYAV